jgi:hypothetical protein
MFVYRTFIVVLPWTGMVDSSEKGAMGVGGDGMKSDMMRGGEGREKNLKMTVNDKRYVGQTTYIER